MDSMSTPAPLEVQGQGEGHDPDLAAQGHTDIGNIENEVAETGEVNMGQNL